MQGTPGDGSLTDESSAKCARMEATQAFSLTNVCEGGDECNTGVRSEEPHNAKGERCDRPSVSLRCAVDFAVHVRCVLSAVGARCAVLRCAVLVRCAVCGASHFQGMSNKKHKQPRARSAEPARAAETAAPGAGASPVPRVSSGPPPASGPSAVVGGGLRVTVAGVWAMWGPSLTYTL
jgi:hypothetical protein